MLQVWLPSSGHQAVCKLLKSLPGAVTCVGLVFVLALQQQILTPCGGELLFQNTGNAVLNAAWHWS